MRIGELARRAGTTTRALRFYEAQGLLEARRSANGYREYDEEDYRLVTEILTLQAVGLSLDDTRPFVECLRAGNEAGDSCTSSIEVYQRKLAEVDACIDRLSAIRTGLRSKLAAALARQAGAGCADANGPTAWTGSPARTGPTVRTGPTARTGPPARPARPKEL